MAPSFWSVLQLGQHARTAMYLLARAGFETYRPLTIERRLVRGCRRDVPQALFPGYLFFLVVNGRWLDAAYTIGVIRVLKNDDRPAAVPDFSHRRLDAALQLVIDGAQPEILGDDGR